MASEGWTIRAGRWDLASSASLTNGSDAMPTRRQVMTAALVALAAIVALIVPTSCYYNRVDPESLQSQLIATGIVGSNPDEAASTLRRLVLPRGCDLVIGEFNAATKLLYASISNAQRRGWHVWRARVTISFDASDRVEGVSVDLTADRPL
jgi:hypothetical protein